jgi:hypothetical protein
MLNLKNLDASTPFLSQHNVPTGPVTIVNTFVAPEGKEDEVLAAWTADAQYMKSTGQLLAVQLYRGIGGSRLFTNVAARTRSGSARPEGERRREVRAGRW